MKTKDFIKMLQEADPKGEAHIRMYGGIPRFAELKEGYWDGPYSYIDEDGNYVYSASGMKVDIYCEDIDDFVERNFNLHDPDNWENIKDKFKFDLNVYGSESSRNEKAQRVLKTAKEDYEMIYDIHKRSFDESEARAVRYVGEEGWTFFQNKLVDDKSLRPNMHHYYTWKIYDKDGNLQSSNIYNVQGVYKSDKFERVDNGEKVGYYQWVMK